MNLYTPSVVTWQRPGGAVVVEQTTNYPAEDAARLTIRAGGRFTLKLRIPAWSQGATIRVNNGPAEPAAAGRYAVLERNWKRGDAVEITLRQPLRTLPIDETHTDVAALLRGAVLYVGLNPWEELVQTHAALPSALTAIRADGYVMNVGGRDLAFAPFYDVQLETYNTYFRLRP